MACGGRRARKGKNESPVGSGNSLLCRASAFGLCRLHELGGDGAERGVDGLRALEVGDELGVESTGARDRRARSRCRPRLALLQSYRERSVSSFFISLPLRRPGLACTDEPNSFSTFSIDHEQDARARRPADQRQLLLPAPLPRPGMLPLGVTMMLPGASLDLERANCI